MSIIDPRSISGPDGELDCWSARYLESATNAASLYLAPGSPPDVFENSPT